MSARRSLALLTAVTALLLATVQTAVASPETTSVASGPAFASNAEPVVVPTTLTAEPVSASLGPFGSLRLFPRARLTITATGEPLSVYVSPGDPGREVVFSVNGKVICTSYVYGGLASCDKPRAALAVIRGGGYDAHFDGFAYTWPSGHSYFFLPSDAHGEFIG
ncbi:hypothetical protein DJ010_08440 [Nocardioides silvaticus]|uniref:Uncharacterized protein n=1 Tax=Nocardioides silvaticus TaxID=2201891 RepID=A0A316TLS0_9ACTN|nr:hypothetical protein [Nocardioides silvaticus]PWN03144.1 hypothetical protein DJ010_08440 [Nocardioides silvaticus]